MKRLWAEFIYYVPYVCRIERDKRYGGWFMHAFWGHCQTTGSMKGPLPWALLCGWWNVIHFRLVRTHYWRLG